MAKTFDKCKAAVHNRGTPPVAFLNKLVDWALSAPDEIFEQNENYDIYSSVKGNLGPYTGLVHRKSVMLEVLRVLGGLESSWNFNEGVDVNNPTSNTACTEEAGIFQCSGNSMNFDPSLKRLLRNASGGPTDCRTFIRTSKENHAFAIEYCARLLRFTVNHHGPVKREEIHPWLRKSAVAEFSQLLSA